MRDSSGRFARQSTTSDFISIVVGLCVIYFGVLYTVQPIKHVGVERFVNNDTVVTTPAPLVDPCELEMVVCPNEVNQKKIYAKVTGYNSVEAQTDATPCQAAGGYICGKTNVVACPRSLRLGQEVSINGRRYICFDRLAKRYDNRFDIFFDKDIQAAKAWGIKELEVTIL